MSLQGSGDRPAGGRDMPVTFVGPGSQPREEDGAALECLELPREVDAYRRPVLPEAGEVHAMTGAMQALEWLQRTLDDYRPEAATAALDISALDADNRELVNQVLGEGEVSVRFRGEVRARTQESVLAGVWRTFHVDDDDMPLRDLLEVGDVPALARAPGGAPAARLEALANADPPPGVINSRPILAELAAHLEGVEPGRPGHVINLTLLPLTPQDLGFLESMLGLGPVAMRSRGYGDCEIASTEFANVWWVRFFNSTGKLILNTLEVVDVPVVARAAPEDLEDSGRRLRELLEPYAALHPARERPSTSTPQPDRPDHD